MNKMNFLLLVGLEIVFYVCLKHFMYTYFFFHVAFLQKIRLGLGVGLMWGQLRLRNV